jgi:hypothetical protein
VRDVAAGRNNDDEDLAAVERDEIEMLEPRAVRGRPDGEPDLVRCPGHGLGRV